VSPSGGIPSGHLTYRIENYANFQMAGSSTVQYESHSPSTTSPMEVNL